MIRRIVKLSFQTEKIPDFLTVFNESKALIRASAGCTHLELWRSTPDDNIFFTYSLWESEKDLDNYRNSDLFKRTWSKTKVLFSDKPRAWSVELVDEIK